MNNKKQNARPSMNFVNTLVIGTNNINMITAFITFDILYRKNAATSRHLFL